MSRLGARAAQVDTRHEDCAAKVTAMTRRRSAPHHEPRRARVDTRDGPADLSDVARAPRPDRWWNIAAHVVMAVLHAISRVLLWGLRIIGSAFQ